MSVSQLTLLLSDTLLCTRSVCCDLSCIQLPKLVTWLMLAFVLCREVPMLSQKVKRDFTLFSYSPCDKLFLILAVLSW